MNLTLRNLLCWLDDTLAPEQSCEFGRMIATSEALPLVARIVKLNLEPRRTDEPREDELDPNEICEYIEDALTPDEVVDFERRCLTSDTVLAEVARVHRALSLRGAKAEVPPAARARFVALNPYD